MKKEKKNTNENKFFSQFNSLEKGRKITVNKHIGTSIDFSFKDEEKEYLIEVDSYNMAKCVVGQYILLHCAPEIKNSSVFVIVHFHKDYRKHRTINHLNFIKSKFNISIPFVVFEWTELNNAKIADTKSFINEINKQLSEKK